MDLKIGRSLEVPEVAELLTEARARTLLLVAPLDRDELRTQHSPLMSPILWDLGHIAHFEEVWLREKLGGRTDADGEGLRGIYNPFENPRAVRDELPLPEPAEALDYLSGVRREVLGGLERLDGGSRDPLLRDGFVFRLVLQHEYQHNETILQTLQLKQGRPYAAPRSLRLPDGDGGRGPEPGAMVRFPGGEVPVGTDDRSIAYDNERPRHLRELRSFDIDVTPVTCGEYLSFMEEGGYERPELWSEDGRAWLEAEGARAPAYWTWQDGEWWVRVMDRWRPVDPRRPVCHVTFHEAEAYARWAGKRLPTEAEWEAAASWDPETGRKRLWPWGDDPPDPTRANLDAVAFDVAPAGAYPRGVSPIGCHQMVGDVWEWTASAFEGYPGFEAFPYREYSEVFFGPEHRVLRGGSWATRPGALRATFRNWDYPIRRQIFSGFRCARDVE